MSAKSTQRLSESLSGERLGVAVSMLSFAHWLATTQASETIRDILWIIPMIQVIHILAVAVVVSSIGMINLRMLELTGRSQSMMQTAKRFLPWVWVSLLVLAVTGATLIVGEPARELNNIAFWTKMSLLFLAIIVTFGFQFTLRRKATLWEKSASMHYGVKIYAVVTFILWCTIIVAGRWIAYVKIPESVQG